MACLCHSANNKFFLLNNRTNSLNNACKFLKGFPAAFLEKQDYENFGRCLPPEPNTNYSIRLIFHRNKTSTYGCNDTYPFFWSFGNGTRTCVDGKPLNLPAKFPFANNCYAATIRPGSSDNIFNNASWTPCAEEQRYICQLEAKNNRRDNLRSCNLIPITGPNTKATTRTSASTINTLKAEETLITNSTATIVGSVLGICVIFFTLIIFFLLYKKKSSKKSTSKNQTQEDVSRSV